MPHHEHHEHPEHKPEEMDGACHCGDKKENGECSCGCGCGKCGCCCKKAFWKFIGLLIVFLAGVGFNQLLHCCCGGCKAHHRPSPMMHAQRFYHNMPAYQDDIGNMIIVVGSESMPTAQPMKGKHHGKHFKHKMPNLDNQNAPAPAPADQPAETAENAGE